MINKCPYNQGIEKITTNQYIQHHDHHYHIHWFSLHACTYLRSTALVKNFKWIITEMIKKRTIDLTIPACPSSFSEKQASYHHTIYGMYMRNES